jgi:hypothetical protein
VKPLITLLSLSLLIASCNNSNKEDAALLQRKNDSLESVLKLQAQQRQIDSLKAEITNVAQTTNNIIEANNERAEANREKRRKQILAIWKYTLQRWNTQLDVDNANLNWASQYHIGRSESTKQREITQASVNVERDKNNILQCQDSVSKYQN